MLDAIKRALLTRIHHEEQRKRDIEEKQREALESAFELVPGDRRFCIRRLEVVDHVARVLGIRVVNNVTFHDVEQMAVKLGWEPVKNGGRALFRCVKRRDLDQEAALAISRRNRHDPRFHRIEKLDR
jgi:hypothetical protein